MKRYANFILMISKCLVLGVCLGFSMAYSAVNSGSDGSDGAFNPTEDVEIDMADHPDGIYHYTSVNIPEGVTVTFKPNPRNTPVVWLVQQDVIIMGEVNLDGKSGGIGIPPGEGGAGGYGGGVAPIQGGLPGEGKGPGGGKVDPAFPIFYGSYASHAELGPVISQTHPPGDLYGNIYLLPLLGGSGGSGGIFDYTNPYSGSGGGGAILIAANRSIDLDGVISARGNHWEKRYDGSGSGGAIRLVSDEITGLGEIVTTMHSSLAQGRVRFDTPVFSFAGSIDALSSHGYQPIIIPPDGQGISLNITKVAGNNVAASPEASPINPDIIVPANISNPVQVIVSCQNIPLNTEIILEAKGPQGPSVIVSALNTTGTKENSTATISINLPRGSGTLQAKAVSGITTDLSALQKEDDNSVLAKTGWLATGEKFAAIEVTSTLGGGMSYTYISESGVRYPISAN